MTHLAWITKLKREEREEEIKNAVIEIDPEVEKWRQ